MARPVSLELFLRECVIWNDRTFFPVVPEKIFVGRERRTPAVAFAIGYERDLLLENFFSSPRIFLLAVRSLKDSEFLPPLFELWQPLGYKSPWWENVPRRGKDDWCAVFGLEHQAEIKEWLAAAKKLL